jgi:hypothetical protein
MEITFPKPPPPPTSMGEAAILLTASILTAGVAIHAMVTLAKAAKAAKQQSSGTATVAPRSAEPTPSAQAPY